MKISIDQRQTRTRSEDLTGVIKMESQWQPIETAPMTGKAILLYSDLWGISIGRWQDRRTMHGFWHYDGYEGREINFNYWMLLPEPPK